jgi:hypothetical protein
MPDTETGSNRNSVRDFRFGSEASRHVLVGSSELMPPSVDLGVEAATPVADPNLDKESE